MQSISNFFLAICRDVGRILPAFALTALVLFAPASRAQSFSVDTSAASPLTGLWGNAGESGWGATLTQQSYMLFVTWFVYDSVGNPVWNTVSCRIVDTVCTGDITRIRGGATPTAPWSGSSIAATRAGSMTLNFTSNDAGSMAYTLDGVGTTKQIARQNFGPPAPPAATLVGSWFGATIEARSNCTQQANNGNRATFGQFDIGMSSGNGGSIYVTLSAVTGLQCTYAGNFTTNGARMTASGTLSCNDGKHGTWQSSNIVVLPRAMSLELGVQLDATETCTIFAVLGGSRL